MDDLSGRRRDDKARDVPRQPKDVVLAALDRAADELGQDALARMRADIVTASSILLGF